MEAKKNPSKDVHRMRGTFFQIGLGISLAIIITAFEWRTEVKKVAIRIEDEPLELMPIIPVTDPKEPLPLSPIKNEIIPSTSVSSAPMSQLTEVPETGPETENPNIEPSMLPVVYSVPVDSAEVCENCIFLVVEKKPEPIGGYETFYKKLKENLKYPRKAQQYNVEGRVFVEFIVNRDGTPVDIKVIRGIGAGCDEEAVRVISLSKWNPGKQRGKPVRVKMSMSVVFKLN